MDRRIIFPPNRTTPPILSHIAHHKRVFCLFGDCADITPFRSPPWIQLVYSIVLVFVLSGCGFGQSKSKPEHSPYADQAKGVFNDYDRQNAALDIPDADESTQWTVVLVSLENQSIAQQALTEVQSTYNLLGARIEHRAGRAVVVYGRYSGPDDTQAKLDLDLIREITTGGSRPFAGAYLAPPPAAALSGSNKEHDLRTVKQRFGPRAIYTLQLGVYGTNDNATPKPSDIKEFRRTSEQAVLELRAKGERAFYYHAPMRSMVTVGVFGEMDFDSTTTPPMESFRLKELRKRYPHNYLNGQGIRETITTDTGQRVTRLQPSALVAIPDK